MITVTSLCSELCFNKMCNLVGVNLIYGRNEGCYLVNRLNPENDRIGQQLFTGVNILSVKHTASSPLSWISKTIFFCLTHLKFLLLTEISRVRKDMYNDTLNGSTEKRSAELPDAVGPIVQLQEKLYVPVKEYPDVSIFVVLLIFSALHNMQ